MNSKIYDQIYRKISAMGNPINKTDVSQYVGYEKAKLDIQQIIVDMQIESLEGDKNNE